VVGYLGYEFIHRLEAWGSAILGVLFVVLTYKILARGDFPVHSTVHGGTAVGMFVLMTTIAFSGGFSWATYAADYSRYMDTDAPRRPLFWMTFAGLSTSFLWMYGIGLAGAKLLSQQTAAGVQSLMGGGVLGVAALIAIVFGSVTGNALNDYSASLAVQAGGVKLKRPYSAAVGTVMAFALILWVHDGNTAARFENILLFTAYWIAPFFAIVLIDWHHRRRAVNRATLLHLLEWQNLESGWPALVALLAGFGAMVPFMDTNLIHGFVSVALDGADIAVVVGFVVAAAVYFPLRQLASHPVIVTVDPAEKKPLPC
jgi:NCS1 family nucleobase:cation symporter-1